MARCRLRPQTKWLLFLFMICLGGIILTYRQLSENDKSRHKNALSKFPSFNENLNVKVKRDAVYEMQVNDVPAIFNQPGNYYTSNALKQKLDYKPPAALTEDQIFRLKGLLKKLYPVDWSVTPDADDMVIDIKMSLDDLGLESQMTCKTIDNMRFGSPVRQSGKKYVDNAFIGLENEQGPPVIIKSQAYDKLLKIECMKKIYNPEKCFSMGNYKMMRELVLLIVLNHPGVIGMLGYCLRGDSITTEMRSKGIIVVLESGNRIQSGSYIGNTWAEKLQYGIELAELLHYLEHSPLGSLGFGNIHTDDFVLVNKEIKLVDLDDFTIGDPKCRTSRDCTEAGYDGSVTECTYGQCVDFNAKRNLQKVNQLFFQSILRAPPMEYEKQVHQLQNDITALKISAQDLVEALRNIVSAKIPPTFKPRLVETAAPARFDHQFDGSQENLKDKVDDSLSQNNQDHIQRKQIQRPDIAPVNGDSKLINHNYERLDKSNYPGKYDYLCPGSKVIWGCAHTVRSLEEARSICTRDAKCKAFVVFSYKPETEKLMTIILKYSTHDEPEKDVGAILFIRRDGVEEPIKSLVGMPKVAVFNNKAERVEPDSKESPGQCVTRILSVTEKARSSRERRLMAHLGLKGLRESDWQKKAMKMYLQKHQGMVDTTAPDTEGGKFIVESLKSNENSKTSRAVFMVERGPTQYHVAYYIAYTVDRMLGLYNVPPTTIRTLSDIEFRKVRGDKQWVTYLRKLQTPEGNLKGVLSIPKSSVMKGEKITLKNLPTMVTEIKKFSRQEKMELEYLFLLWLTKATQTPRASIGYKGHFVLFDGDAAFQYMAVNLIGYFNHCQFPNVAYKLLTCHKCHTGSSQSVCTLGQQVVDKVKADGFTESEIMIGRKNFADLATVIDDAATVTLVIVEHCIRKFGREAVLY